jgi:hypothetical protein
MIKWLLLVHSGYSSDCAGHIVARLPGTVPHAGAARGHTNVVLTLAAQQMPDRAAHAGRPRAAPWRVGVLTFDVRIYKLRIRPGLRRPFAVRWRVGGTADDEGHRR